MSLPTWQNAHEIAEAFLVGVWQHADEKLAREIVSYDVIRHHARTPTRGLEPYLALIRAYQRAFPGFTNEILCVTGDTNTVAVHYRSAGIHTGWWGKIPPSYQAGAIEAIDLYKLQQGKICEVIPMWDELGLVQQLGLTCVNPWYFVKALARGCWHRLHPYTPAVTAPLQSGTRTER